MADLTITITDAQMELIKAGSGAADMDALIVLVKNYLNRYMTAPIVEASDKLIT